MGDRHVAKPTRPCDPSHPARTSPASVEVKRTGIGARVSSAFVFLCELEDLDGESEDNQLYVGMSRARNHCVIVAPPAPE